MSVHNITRSEVYGRGRLLPGYAALRLYDPKGPRWGLRRVAFLASFGFLAVSFLATHGLLP